MTLAFPNVLFNFPDKWHANAIRFLDLAETL